MVRFFTGSEEQGYGTSTDEVWEAFGCSMSVLGALRRFQGRAKTRFPDETEVVKTIDMVIETLRDQHGGMDPDDFFDRWMHDRRNGRLNRLEDRLCFGPKVLRWCDRSKLNEEFYPLHPLRLFQPSLVVSKESIEEVNTSLKQWLQKQKVNQSTAS